MEKVLDDILFTLNAHKGGLEKHKALELCETKLADWHDVLIAEECIDLLMEDGYVIYKSDFERLPKTYRTSIKGKIFCKEGGYTERIKRNGLERTIAKRNELLVAFGSIGAAIAASGLLIVELMNRDDNPYLFRSGIIVGVFSIATVMLLIWAVLELKPLMTRKEKLK